MACPYNALEGSRSRGNFTETHVASPRDIAQIVALDWTHREGSPVKAYLHRICVRVHEQREQDGESEKERERGVEIHAKTCVSEEIVRFLMFVVGDRVYAASFLWLDD
jgi:hypothetical protein